MKAVGQYFTVVLFANVILYKVALHFESVVEILICDHANEICSVVLSLAMLLLLLYFFPCNLGNKTLNFSIFEHTSERDNKLSVS